jgi:hypothetical protein
MRITGGSHRERRGGEGVFVSPGMGVPVELEKTGIGLNQECEAIRERVWGVEASAQTENGLFFYPFALHR